MSYWLFQSTISCAFGTYLIYSRYLTSPWTALAALTSTMIIHYPFATPPSVTQISATAVVHSLFSYSDLNWLLTSVLILNAIPFVTYQIFLLLNPPQVAVAVAPPRLMGWRYFFMASEYLFSIKGLYQYWENEDGLGICQSYIGTMMLLISFYCLEIDRPRRLREADIARDIRVVAGLGRRAWA